MDRKNAWIWNPTAFNHLRRRLDVVCERKSFSWRGVVAQVENILADDKRLYITITGASRDAQGLTAIDELRARIAAVVVLEQPQFRSYRRRLRLFISVPPGTQVAIDPERRATRRAIARYMRCRNPADHSRDLKAAALALLLLRTGRAPRHGNLFQDGCIGSRCPGDDERTRPATIHSSRGKGGRTT